jgi:threonine dehydratase
MIGTEFWSSEKVASVRKVLRPHIRRTPTVMASPEPNLSLKLELLQKGGSFKLRGALAQAIEQKNSNPLLHTLVAVSGGNHGIATALAGCQLGLSAIVFMDESTPRHKIRLCEESGARVLLKKTRTEAFESAMEQARSPNSAFVHPFDHPNTILATASIGLEILEDQPELEAVIVPVGGGGLLAGVSAAVKHLLPSCKVYGVQAAAAAAAARSFRSGEVEANSGFSRSAFSLSPPKVGELCMSFIRQNVDDIVVVEESEITSAMRSLLRSSNILVEGACATTLAAWMGPLHGALKDRKTCLLLGGSNISPAEWLDVTNDQ